MSHFPTTDNLFIYIAGVLRLIAAQKSRTIGFSFVESRLRRALTSCQGFRLDCRDQDAVRQVKIVLKRIDLESLHLGLVEDDFDRIVRDLIKVARDSDLFVTRLREIMDQLVSIDALGREFVDSLIRNTIASSDDTDDESRSYAA